MVCGEEGQRWSRDVSFSVSSLPTHSLLTATRLLFGMALVSQSGEGGISTFSNHFYTVITL